MELLLGRVAET